MKKCVIVSDSFKGTLSSMEISYIAEQTIPEFFPECNVVPIPVADGGEGTVDSAFAALSAEPVTIEVAGPYMDRVIATYAIKDDFAIIEMAAAAGLPLVGDKKDPSLTTTYGVGQMIEDAVLKGCKKIYLGLGGSATNDVGCGAAAALGVKFYNEQGKPFIPSGATLKNVAKIDTSACKRFLENVKITAMCDVVNPLFGSNGAAYIFGPQKGADINMIMELDSGMEHLNNICISDLDKDLTYIVGGGAAGGFGAGVMAFLGGELVSGIDVILDILDFDKLLDGCDLVITGEGRLDDQSFSGKVLDGITKRTLPKEIPVYAIVGIIGDLTKDVSNYGISAVFETNREHLPFEEVIPRAWEDYERALREAMHYRRLFERSHLSQ